MKLVRLPILLSMILGLGTAIQAQPKHIYIANDDHTDYMWAADEATYRQVFLDMLDYYLNLADSTQGELPPYQSRFNCDGSFWAWTYEKNRSADQMNRLAARIRDGHISVPYNTLASCYGAQPAEAVLRGMYYAGTLERRFNLKLTLASSIENQTLPYGLVSLWSGSGALYSWKGICGSPTKIPGVGDRENQLYWWRGPDGSRLLTKWYSQLQGTTSVGGYAEAAAPSSVVNFMDQNSRFLARYPYRVSGAFGYGGDALRTRTSLFVSTAKSMSNADRQVYVSNEQDFFEDIKRTYGSILPTEGRSYGNEWDLYCASLAEVTGRVKRAVEKLRGAEALATLVSLRRPDFMTPRKAARDQAWLDLGLYWEHDWTADGGVSRSARAAWQRRLAGEIESYVNTLQADAAAALGGMIANGSAYPRFYVFNPLGWSRTDRADLPYNGSASVHVIDLARNEEAPSQIVTLEGQRYLRVLARGVPPAGYKVYQIVPGPGTVPANAVMINGGVMENGYYRLTVSPGGTITSLLDKTRARREFARTVSGRAINDLGSSAGSLYVENAGPVSATLVATGSSPLRHTSRITLTRDSDRIELHNTIDQNFGSTYSWGFGFALNAPDTWHEEVGAVIRARLTTAGGQYAPRCARYDWLTLNHFADMSDPAAGVGVTLSNADCSFMRLGLSTATSLDTATPLISALAGGQIDGSLLGIPNQGGDASFLQRFALRTHGAYDQAAAMRFALEHQNPLLAAPVTGSVGSYPATNYSLLAVSRPEVLLWALKPADDVLANGLGFVARFWNLAGTPATCTLSASAASINAAWRLTHVETPLASAPVAGGTLTTTLGSQQLQTFALALGPAPTPTPTPTPTPSPANGLVAYWRFDEGAGSRAWDSSGRNNTGTVVGATWSRAGRVRGALNFQSGNAHVAVPNSASLGFSGNRMTLAAWVYPTSLASPYATIIQRSNARGSWQDWNIYAWAGDAPAPGRSVFRINWDGDNENDRDETAPGDLILATKTWQFIACTYDGTALRFYLNGTYRGKVVKYGGRIPNSGRPIWIGANDLWGEPFRGQLDEVRLYERALNQTEIQALMKR